MSNIRAPFNFVPLSDKVYFPEWGDRISQDIPFSDGVSGVIDLTITAQTPIFVRNGHAKGDNDPKSDNYENFKSFSKTPDGQFFIPATSVKGVIRNALEILSFGKMSHIGNKRYAIRDLKLKKEYLEKFSTDVIHCGWMRKDGENVIIEDHGVPYRISHLQIDKQFDTNFCHTYEGDYGKSYLKRSEIHKHAADKYKLFGTNSLLNTFKDGGKCTNTAVDNRLSARFSDEGWKGTIVFTGQPGERKPRVGERKASGKFFEFVFKEDVINTYTKDIYEENGLFEDFCFIYQDSDDWRYWKKKFEEGKRVPIFMNTEGGKLNHIGLSYLYKLPAAGHIKDYLYPRHKKDEPDFTEGIFGYTSNSTSLRGRVQFSHAFCTEGVVGEELVVYMGSPKPSYYPMYIKQKGENGLMVQGDRVIDYSTLLSKDAELKGWKMYPVRKEEVDDFEIPDGQEDNCNHFIPLLEGSKFHEKIIFHNLKKEELAGLVYAIELKNGSLHSVGFAKPFGYGVSVFKINSIDITECIGEKEQYKDTDSLIKFFETFMGQQIPDYSKTPQIREFNAMTKYQQLKRGHSLEYMELQEFVDAKKQHKKQDKNFKEGDYLVYYSEMKDFPKKEMKVENLYAEAVVTIFSGGMKKAKLSVGKDLSSKELVVLDKKVKLKMGDKIEVEKLMNGGNVVKLKFIRKL